MREGGDHVYAGAFVFDGSKITPIEELFGGSVHPCPADVMDIATAVRETQQEQYICQPDSTMIVGYPITLRCVDKTYLKGCFIGKPPLRDTGYLGAIRQIVKLFADLLSERISSVLAARIARQDYQSLKLNVSQIASVTDNLGGGLVLLDKDLRIVWSNTVPGKSAVTPDMSGMCCYETVFGREEPCDNCQVIRAFETKKPQVGQVPVRLRSGELRYFQMAAAPVFNDKGEVDQVLELVYDATAARIAETELARYKRLVNGSDDFMLVCDQSGCILAVNRKMTEGLGYTEEELVGADSSLIIRERKTADGAEIACKAQTVGRTTDLVHLIRKDESIVPTQVVSTYDSDHKVYECIFRDISERLRMEDAIKRQNNELQAQNARVMAAIEEKDRFFRSVSHELRTPLTSVIAFSELLLEDTEEPLTENQKSALDRINNNAYRLLSLVNNLLDLSKLESHKMTVELAPVELSDIFDQILSSMRPIAQEKGIVISADISSNLPEIHTDEQKLGQIILNLVSNAIKFTSEGSVAVSAYSSGRSVVIAVQDTGIGIPEHELPEIFKEFYQGKKRNGKQQGTGLGLAIAQRLAILLGGGITVRSEEDSGSTFTLELPLTLANRAPSRQSNSI